MNTDVLDKPIVLSLNRAWQVIGHRTVKQALIALNGGAAGLPPALGVDIAYPKLHVRVPTVIVSTQFDRMPLRIPRVTRAAIFERDRGVCQYTGEHVGKNGGNLGPRCAA